MFKLVKETYNELKKVRWAKKDEVFKATQIVLSLSVILIALFALVDLGINWVKTLF